MAVTDQTPLDQYTGDAVTVTFAYNFMILQSEALGVLLNNSATAEAHLSGYTVAGVGDASGGSITFTGSPAAPASGINVRLERWNPFTQTIDFVTGAEINANTIEKMGDKLTHLAQEINRRAFQESADGTLDAATRRLKNLVDPVNAQDAATKTWSENAVTSSVSAAQTAQTAAEVAQVAAELAETNAQSSEDDAQTSEDAAQSSEDDAQTSEDNAATSATNSATSASSSSTSASASATSAAASAASNDQSLLNERLCLTWQSLAAGSAASASFSSQAADFSAVSAEASAALVSGALSYKGVWGSPAAYPTTPTPITGHLYITATAATVDGISYVVGDSIVFNASGSPEVWDKIDNATGKLSIASDLSDVASVSTSRTNLSVHSIAEVLALTWTESDITDLQSYILDITGEALGTLSDVTISSIASGEILKWNGSAFINNTLAEASIAAASHNHAGADITSGTVAYARLPTGTASSTVAIGDHTHTGSTISALDAGDTTTGTFADARIPNLNASKITAGTLVVARGGTGVTAKTGTGNVVLSASPTFTGTAVFAGASFSSAPTKSALGIPYYVSGGYTGGKITVSSSAPSTPANGDIWFDTS